MPKVSVVIPVYNNQIYVRECVESAINQTLKDIEIICVDDGSTDGSPAVLDEYAAKDSRVKVIHKENAGYGVSMNTGMDKATGEYFAILESDDYIQENMLENLYNLCEKNNLDFVKADYRVFVGENKDRQFEYMTTCRTCDHYNKVLNPEKDTTVFNDRMNTWTGIYKMSFLKEHNIRHNETPGASYQDNGFWFQTFLWAKRMMFTDTAYYQLRRDNPGSSVHNKGKVYCIFDEYDFIENILKSDEHKHDVFKEIFQKKKFDSCLFHYSRIGDEFKLEFLQRMSKEFKEPREKGEIVESIYIGSGYATINEIIDDPEGYYVKTTSRESGFKNSDEEIKYLKAKNKQLEGEIKSLKNSVSFKIGRGITFIPRCFKKFFKTLKVKGFKYTFQRIGQKLAGK